MTGAIHDRPHASVNSQVYLSALVMGNPMSESEIHAKVPYGNYACALPRNLLAMLTMNTYHVQRGTAFSRNGCVERTRGLLSQFRKTEG